jgi:hypothetical protein
LDAGGQPTLANVIELVGGSRKQQTESRWRVGFVTVAIAVKGD